MATVIKCGSFYALYVTKNEKYSKEGVSFSKLAPFDAGKNPRHEAYPFEIDPFITYGYLGGEVFIDISEQINQRINHIRDKVQEQLFPSTEE